MRSVTRAATVTAWTAEPSSPAVYQWCARRSTRSVRTSTRPQPLPRVRLVRELVEQAIERERVPPVQLPALPGHQLPGDHLADEAVAQRVALGGGVDDDERGGPRLPQRRHQGRLREPHHLGRAAGAGPAPPRAPPPAPPRRPCRPGSRPVRAPGRAARRRGPPSSPEPTARRVSATMNALPRERCHTRSTSSGSSPETAATRRRTVPRSSGPRSRTSARGWRPSSATIVCSGCPAASASGRIVSTTRTGSRRRCAARVTTTSRVQRSAQCRSSTATRTGAASASAASTRRSSSRPLSAGIEGLTGRRVQQGGQLRGERGEHGAGVGGGPIRPPARRAGPAAPRSAARTATAPRRRSPPRRGRTPRRPRRARRCGSAAGSCPPRPPRAAAPSPGTPTGHRATNRATRRIRHDATVLGPSRPHRSRAGR